MATKEQMDFFKSVYEEEEKRTATLLEHSRSNVTLVTLYSGFALFVLEKQADGLSAMGFTLFAVALGAMAASFFLSLLVTNIATYEALTDPEEIIAKLGPTPPTNEEFFDARIIDYTAAYHRNSAVNDGKAEWLSLARYALLLGVVLHASFFVCTVWGRSNDKEVSANQYFVLKVA
ncbi:hypothetical protein J2Z31_002814 [Sinorhizobium kostiense]|uniref:Uncharacterized protein n=1 Tax=Sinorhizobium kostiense TaxID=76747 RepID=A0ABS4R084_9HYPH|nr:MULTISPECIES: hypothetical protein [Sinorhizobium]MBP2236300.1 hypothetical protein [Sinorhizobium kostiense]PST20704.1 hypothetical protein C7U60_14840 [Mesorhizobium plurifarium]